MSAFLLSAGIIFVAELGDKSQLVALWSATRYKWWLVLAGVSLATLVVHLGSVGIGRAFDELLPENIVFIVVGLSFFVFAAWSIRGDQLDETKRSSQARTMLGAFGVITASFFVSELGDKTQLATISLAEATQRYGSSESPGSTVGIGGGHARHWRRLGDGKKELPQRTLGIGAAILFVIFGIVALVRGLTM